jgi:S-formylglutathione hydrolase FrmB
MITPSMRAVSHRRSVNQLLTVILILSTGCRRKETEQPDPPRLTLNVALRDVTFRSAALNREMQYRIVLPSGLPSGQEFRVIYLLHGGGGGFKDWSNYSDVARFAEFSLLLVMPEGGSSYYTNAVDPPPDRYEDYVVRDLISDVESRFPAAPGRSNRAIVGISMGGFGAVKLALRHPDLFSFVGGISSAIGVPRRAFSIKRLQQSRHYNAILGRPGARRGRTTILLFWPAP